MTGSGSAAPGRRLLVATAVARYPKAPQWDRPGLADARQQVIDLFTGTLGYAHVSDLGLDPTKTQLTEHLRTLCRHHVRPEDHLVVYIAGHGELLDDGNGRHVLLTADTDPDDVADALPTLRLADKMLLGTPVQRLLLLLDTCYSGSGGNQVAAAVLAGMEREWATSGSGLVVVSSTQPFEQAETGAFPALLSAVVHALSTAGQVPPSLDLGGVVQAMNSHPERSAHQRIGWTALGLTGTLPDFLPNPRHRRGMTDIDLHLQQVAEWDAHAQRREVEFRRRFLIEAMASQGTAQAWWFSGRRVALTDITTWLTQPSPQQAQLFPQDVPSPVATPAAQLPDARALVVTAGPGSGKTAVLGLVSALTHPEHRPTIPIDAIQLPPEAIPPIGAVDVTIYAGGLTHDQVQAGLAAAAQIRAGTIGELIKDLDARATASGRPFTAIIDALDEAADPAQLITQVLRPVIDHAHGVRLLLGTRPHLLKLLQPPRAPGRVGVIDLDAPRWADRQALTVYTIRNLIEASPDSPYRDAGPQVWSVADAVADAADPSFLVARIISTTLAAAGTLADPTDPNWRADLPGLPGDAMRNDLDTRLGPNAVRARDLLRPLAYAEGQGLPWEDIWAPLASRISGRTYTNDDLHWLRQHAGSYIVEATEAGRSAYRLYHQALTEHLRATTAVAGLTGTTIHHQAYVDVLTARVPRTLEATRDWAHAHPYTLHHLATHAAAAGTLDPLLDDAGGVPAISWTFPLCCFWCPIVKLALVIRWAYLAEPTLFPDVIVISLDVVEHGGPDLARVAPHVLIDQLLLDRRIKRFRCRVVVAYAGVPDRRDNTLGEKAIAVPSRGILGTAVMVRHKLAYAYSRPAGGQRIIQGLEHQARAHVVIHGPADDLIRAHVDKRRQVRETRIRPDIGDIADPQLVRLRGGELAVHQIDQAADCLAVLHGRPRRRPGMHALQARGPRQAAHPPLGGDVPLLLQVPQDPLDAGPVLMPFLMQVPDPRGQLSVLLIMRRDRPLLPLVISLPRHFQHTAHENDGKAHPGRQLPLLFRHLANEREFHRFWLAKYALAFFRNAFSMLRRRTSASSSLIRVRSAGVSGASPTATASLSLSFLTQLARVDSFSPRFRAVSAIV